MKRSSRNSRPKLCSFRGIQYRILWRAPKGQKRTVGGTCQAPWVKNCAIEVHPKLKGQNRLRCLIDEAIHACHWDLDNDCVGETSLSIAGFLWDCGLRFNEQKEKK